MPRSVRTISVNLTAGTAQFFTDLQAASGRLRQFGREGGGSVTPITEGFQKMGHEGVTGVQAVSGALRVMEGGLNNNLRAAERFVANVLGLGPALQTIFPIVGGVAFIGLLTKMSEEAYKFYKSIAFAGEEMQGTFRGLSAPLRLANDELALANVRLENDIAKLEGHHENTLAAALMEAKVAADKLADSLDRDLAAIYKVLNEETRMLPIALLHGEVATADIREYIGGKTGFGGLRGQIAQITDEGNARIAAAQKLPDPKAALKAEEDAREEMNKRLQAKYTEGLKHFQDELQKATAGALGFDALAKAGVLDTVQKVFGNPEQRRIEDLKASIRSLQELAQNTELSGTNTSLTLKKDILDSQNANAKQERPFEDRMKALAAQADGLRAKLAAVGTGLQGEILAKAFAEGQKAIEEVNKALERYHRTLTAGQKAQIENAVRTNVQLEAETAWQTKLDETTRKIDERIAATNLLTEAIGKGYEAERNARVEGQVAQALGERYFTVEGLDEARALRQKFIEQDDAEHRKSVAEAIDKLNDQIKLEKELARVASEGAEAVRRATLAVKLEKMADEGATKEQIQAEKDLYDAQRATANANQATQLTQKIEATERLTKATLQSAEAVRRATLENRVAELQKEGATPEVIEKARTESEANYKLELAELLVRVDRVRAIGDEIAKLKDAKAILGDTLPLEISLRDLENQRLKILAEQSLQLRTARDGLRAFFIEMQEDAKSSAQIVYDALNSALDRVSENLAKLFTGQRTSWAKAFQDIGEQIAQSSIKSILQIELGKLGEHFGITGKPDGTASNPWYVRLAGPTGTTTPANPLGPAWNGIQIPGLNTNGGGFESNPLSSVLKSGTSGIESIVGRLLFGPGGSSGNGEAIGTLSNVVASFPGFAGGNDDISPGTTAWIAEDGPELVRFGSRASVTPINDSRLGRGGDSYGDVFVDARGADLGAANRVQAALHRQTVATAVRAMHERAHRVPKGSR